MDEINIDFDDFNIKQAEPKQKVESQFPSINQRPFQPPDNLFSAMSKGIDESQ
jgi:hypothetical protein